MASGGGKSWSIITAASTKTGRPRYLRARPNLRRESAKQRAVRRCPSIRRNSSSIWRTIRKSRCCHAPCIQHVSLRGAISPVHWTKSSVYQASRQAGRHVDGYIAQYTGYAGKQSNVQSERFANSRQGKQANKRAADGYTARHNRQAEQAGYALHSKKNRWQTSMLLLQPEIHLQIPQLME